MGRTIIQTLKTSKFHRKVIFREIKKLKACFDSLDDDGSGSIGIEELEDPLIGLGFAETREEVKAIVDSVDEDRSGLIEFDEFLGIIKNSDSSGSNQKIFQFFKDMSSGNFTVESDTSEEDENMETASQISSKSFQNKKLKKQEKRIREKAKLKAKNKDVEDELSFNLLVQKIRRKHMMDAIISDNKDKKRRGMKILKNVAKLLKAKKAKRDREEGLDEDEFEAYKI